MILLTLRCDGCGRLYAAVHGTAPQARRIARSDGWTTARGPYGRVIDRCPGCSRETAGKVQDGE